MSDLIDRQQALDCFHDWIDRYGNEHTSDEDVTYQRIAELPAVQPDHTADIGKKVSISCAHENDVISREAAIDALARMMPRSYTPDGSHPADEEIFRAQEVFADCIEALEILPSAQPEIIHCGECIYYDPPHVEKEDARYEYSEMPKEAFDVLGTGLVSMEYGINIGGRCCVDYYCKSYSDDKRVYVREDNYCGRAERRTDETD